MIQPFNFQPLVKKIDENASVTAIVSGSGIDAVCQRIGTLLNLLSFFSGLGGLIKNW